MKWYEYVTPQQLADLKAAAQRILGTDVRVKQDIFGHVELVPEREMD